MAAITAERDTVERQSNNSQRHAPLATAAVQFYRGGLVARDASTGLIVKAVAGTATDTVVGRCGETKLTVSGDTIDLKSGIFLYTQDGSITQVMKGKLCYVVDDQTVTEDSATGTPPVAGTVYERVSASEVYVETVFTAPPVVALNPSP